MENNGYFRRVGLVVLAMTLLSVAPGTWSQANRGFEIPTTNSPLAAADLEVLVGPIALYADDLVGIVLPASTYPLQIVQASRFLDRLQEDASLQPDPNWDNSVVALLNYPEVVRLLDLNIEWTWALGEAVLDQQAAVMDAIQDFRRQSLQAGNLSSDAQQTITQNENLIEISPADPEVIYVPYYEPEQVVVVQPTPLIHYYSDPYPVYYYPYPVGYRFHTGFFWGITSAFHIGWHTHALHVYNHRNRLHPYFGRTYYSPYYARRSVNVNINVNRANQIWTPRQRRAARPHRVENRARVTVNRERAVNRGTARQNVARPRVSNSRANAQQSVRPQQRANRTTVQPPTVRPDRRSEISPQPQAAGSQRANRRSSPNRQRADNSATSPARRPSHTFASPQSRRSNPARVTATRPRQSTSQRAASPGNVRAPRAAAPARTNAPAQRGGSRRSAAAGRSSARGSGQNAGRTRR